MTGGIIGSDPEWRRAMKRIKMRAVRGLSTIIHGGSGTGKEIAARHYHNSAVTEGGCVGQVVSVNCGALSPSLWRSELCGVEPGAYTGALKHKRDGCIHRADDGTLHLDEIADLCPEAQVGLLRVLEDGIVVRVGAVKGIRVNVRVVATTKTDLRELVNEGRFREDLWYRLAQVNPVVLPSINERCREDRLAFVRRAVPRGMVLSSEAEELLISLDYTDGGVRDVGRAVRSACEEAEIAGVRVVGVEHVLVARAGRVPEIDGGDVDVRAFVERAISGGASAKDLADHWGVDPRSSSKRLKKLGYKSARVDGKWCWVKSGEAA